MAEYIKREDALKVIETANSMASSFLERTMELCVIMDRIAAADVVPVRHGRWLKYAPHNSDLMTCSECEKYWILDGDQYDYHYCPNCGALMDKDGDGE